MDPEIAALVRELKDRQEIYECVVRYSRGMDRFDRDVILSAYHPDAVDDHGIFVGTPEAFVDFFFTFHGTYQHRTQHHITNHICELDGDVAHAESYYIFRSLNKEGPLYTTSSGRYVDRFEKRNGRWAIAARVCTVDVNDELAAPTGFEADTDFVAGRRDKNDVSYMRPLAIDPARMTG